jgi:hypothetical protein
VRGDDGRWAAAVTQSVDQAAGCEASAGNAGGEPRAIHFREEASNLAPTSALAGLAGITYQHHEEIETVAGGVDHAVGSGADEVAKDGQQLKKDSGRMGFGVRSDGTDGEPRQSIQGGFA